MTKHKLRLTFAAVLGIFALATVFVMSAYRSYQNLIATETQRIEAEMADVSEFGSAALSGTLSRLEGEGRAAAGLVAQTGTESELLYRCFDQNSAQSHCDATLLFTGEGLLKYGALEYRDAFTPCAMNALVSGTSAMSGVLPFNDGISRFALSVPFTDVSGALGAVTLIYPVSVLSDLESYAVSDNSITLRLLKTDGSAVIPDANPCPWQFPQAGDRPVLEVISGSYVHCRTTAGSDCIVFASPTGVNGWYLVTGVPMSYINARAESGFSASTSFILISFAIFAALLLFSIVFILSRQRRLYLERQRFSFATSQSNRAVFEYSRETDRLTFISNCENISFPNDERAVSLASFFALLKPDDRTELEKAIRILNEEGCTQVTLRMSGLRKSCDYHWYHITAEELSGSHCVTVIGTIEDIDEREKERIALLRKAVTDPLTGLYNRAETERMISEHLSKLQEGQSGTFCIVDMDNFKLVNDNNGHDCGDKALLFFAERLRATFRFGDIIGRLGGDEFVVYMALTSDRSVVLRRFDELMDSLSRRTGDECLLPELACSIGCVAAQPGDDFGVVYNLADKALYRAKSSGKRRAEFEETA